METAKESEATLGNMSLAEIRKYLVASGADKEAESSLGLSVGKGLDMDELKRNLLDAPKDEALAKMEALKAKQMKIQLQTKEDEDELYELKKAEELYQEELLKQLEERDKIMRELRDLERKDLESMAEQATRELEVLEQEKKEIEEKEKEHQAAIEKVRQDMRTQEAAYQRALEDARRKSVMASHQRNEEKGLLMHQQIEMAKVHGQRMMELKLQRDQLENELRVQEAPLASHQSKQGQGNTNRFETLLTKQGLEEQQKRVKRLRAAMHEDSGIKDLEEFEKAERQLQHDLKTIAGAQSPDSNQNFLEDWMKRKPASGAAQNQQALSSRNSSGHPVMSHQLGNMQSDQVSPFVSSKKLALEQQDGAEPKTELEASLNIPSLGRERSLSAGDLRSPLEKKPEKVRPSRRRRRRQESNEKNLAENKQLLDVIKKLEDEITSLKEANTSSEQAPEASQWPNGMNQMIPGQPGGFQMQQPGMMLGANPVPMMYPYGMMNPMGPFGPMNPYNAMGMGVGMGMGMFGQPFAPPQHYPGMAVPPYILAQQQQQHHHQQQQQAALLQSQLDAESLRIQQELEELQGLGSVYSEHMENPAHYPLAVAPPEMPISSGDKHFLSPKSQKSSVRSMKSRVSRQRSSVAEPPDSQTESLKKLDVEHRHKIKEIEYEMERLSKEQKLIELKEQIKDMQEAQQKEKDHAQWLEDQKREMQALRVGKAIAREKQLLLMQGGGSSEANNPNLVPPSLINVTVRTYNAAKGFAFVWDYAGNLPLEKGQKYRLVYGLYMQSHIQGNLKSTSWKTASETFSVFEYMDQFPQRVASPWLRVIIELQTKISRNAENKYRDKKKQRSLGWQMFWIFHAAHSEPKHLALNCGMHRLSIDPGDPDPLLIYPGEEHGKHIAAPEIFFRLVHGQDAKASADMPSDPATQPLYKKASVLKTNSYYSAFRVAVAAVKLLRPLAEKRKKAAALKKPLSLDLSSMKSSFDTDPHSSSTSLFGSKSNQASRSSTANKRKNSLKTPMSSSMSQAKIMPTPTAGSKPDLFSKGRITLDLKTVADGGDKNENTNGSQPNLFNTGIGLKNRATRKALNLKTVTEGDDESEKGNSEQKSDKAVAKEQMEEKQEKEPENKLIPPPLSIRTVSNDTSSRNKAPDDTTQEDKGALKNDTKSIEEKEVPNEEKVSFDFSDTDSDSDSADEKIDDFAERKSEEKKEEVPVIKQFVEGSVKSSSRRRSSISSRRAFSNGDGFDLYVDGLRHVPDNTSFCRVSVKTFDTSGELVGEEATALSKASSLWRNPSFELRREYRADAFDLTLALLIRVDTIEVQSQKLMGVGYTAWSIFTDAGGKSVVEANQKNCYLNEGNFQIPLFSQPPKSLKGLSFASMKDVPRVPCATILLRMKQAPKSLDGFSCLSKDTVAEADWARFGVVVPAPDYQAGRYDSSSCIPSSIEKSIYERRSEEPQRQVHEIGEKITKHNIPPMPSYNSSDETPFNEWMAEVLGPGKPRLMMDYSMLTPYCEELGFQVCIDGLYNVTSSGMFASTDFYKVIYSLSPPALFYQDPPLAEEANFTLQYDLESSQYSPKFSDGFQSYENIPSDPTTHIIFEVRRIKVEMKAGQPKFHISEPSDVKKSSWGILPVFKFQEHCYVASGSFMVPLIQGQVPPDILSSDDPYDLICSMLQAKKSKGKKQLVEGTSLMVRILDHQIQGTILNSFDNSFLNEKYVRMMISAAGKSSEKWEYLVNKFSSDSKTVSRLIPKRIEKLAFIKDLNRAFAQCTGIDHYAL